MCIHCRQLFSTRVTAARHLLGSVLRGSCSTRGPTSLTAFAPPQIYDCPIGSYSLTDQGLLPPTARLVVLGAMPEVAGDAIV
eukprot:8351099-Pyramimonas_sp.AAC.1